MAVDFALASIVFKDNIVYSRKIFHGSKTLFKYAKSMKDINTNSSIFIAKAYIGMSLYGVEIGCIMLLEI